MPFIANLNSFLALENMLAIKGLLSKTFKPLLSQDNLK